MDPGTQCRQEQSWSDRVTHNDQKAPRQTGSHNQHHTSMMNSRSTNFEPYDEVARTRTNSGSPAVAVAVVMMRSEPEIEKRPLLVSPLPLTSEYEMVADEFTVSAAS